MAPLPTRGLPEAEPTPVPRGAYAPSIIVLLTDGASNQGPPPIVAAQQAADRGVRIYTIGYGTERGGVMDCSGTFSGYDSWGGGWGGGGPGSATKYSVARDFRVLDILRTCDTAEEAKAKMIGFDGGGIWACLLYTSPSPRDRTRSRMPSSA